MENSVPFRLVQNESEAAACHALMRQLRPNLSTPAEFLERWHRQSEGGYRLMAGWQGRTPVALAGYRFTENLVHGRHLYVDDLVTDATSRGQGRGRALLRHLKAEATARGCSRLVLDSGLGNTLAHRFYYREGLLAEALHFIADLA